MVTVTLKKVEQSFRYSSQLKTTKYEISGTAPFVEKFILIEEKPKEAPYV